MYLKQMEHQNKGSYKKHPKFTQVCFLTNTKNRMIGEKRVDNDRMRC